MITINEKPLEWREGMTVDDVLEAMNYSFSHIMVSVDGKYVAEIDWDTFPVPDEAVVQAIHIFHGG
ncbi:MAG: sulfur carrier protein ThiS [bacterium]|nr:sulfur carrier protein ThiS [bacterium]